jgi:regulator of RNase E activity RraA
LLQLKRWNTPTIYNGWEQITKHDRTRDAINLEETRDFMPQMGPMVGYAVTLVIELSNPAHSEANPNAWSEYRYVASVPGPKIIVVQDLDKPRVIGSFWGEVNSNTHRALGCVNVTDGAIRDLDEMPTPDSRRWHDGCVGHAYSVPVRWNCEVEVFGQRIQPGHSFTRTSTVFSRSRTKMSAPVGCGPFHGCQRMQHRHYGGAQFRGSPSG